MGPPGAQLSLGSSGPSRPCSPSPAGSITTRPPQPTCLQTQTHVSHEHDLLAYAQDIMSKGRGVSSSLASFPGLLRYPPWARCGYGHQGLGPSWPHEEVAVRCPGSPEREAACTLSGLQTIGIGNVSMGTAHLCSLVAGATAGRSPCHGARAVLSPGACPVSMVGPPSLSPSPLGHSCSTPRQWEWRQPHRACWRPWPPWHSGCGTTDEALCGL